MEIGKDDLGNYTQFLAIQDSLKSCNSLLEVICYIKVSHVDIMKDEKYLNKYIIKVEISYKKLKLNILCMKSVHL